MSYYAHRSGELNLTKTLDEILEELNKKSQEEYIDLRTYIFDKFEIDVDDIYYDKIANQYVMTFYNDEKYNEDNYINMLESLAKYIVQPASIKFQGEDDYVWKIVLENNETYACSGSIVYDDEKPRHIKTEDIENLIQTEEFKQCIGDIGNVQEIYNNISEQLERTETYWKDSKIKELLFAITLFNYFFNKKEGLGGETALATAYINKIIDKYK